MATLPFEFDANNVEPQGDMSPLPAGEYKVIIQDSSMKPTRSGDGQFLELVFSLVEGSPNPKEFHNRKIWDRLNIVNKNQTAQDIAKRQLSAICHAIGVMKLKDSSQLHNKPLLVKVAYLPEKDGYPAKNEIKSYKPAITKTQPKPKEEATVHETEEESAPWETAA